LKQDKTYGTYPIVAALVSYELGLQDLGAVSLVYVNLMEIVAALVRMGVIDYMKAQEILSRKIQNLNLHVNDQLSDLSQSFPIADIASMRHESSHTRMFMS
jgi:urease accessory protein UreF